MHLPPRTRQRLQDALDARVEEGKALQRGASVQRGATHTHPVDEMLWSEFGPRPRQWKDEDTYRTDESAYRTWATRCASLLAQLLPANSVHRGAIEEFRDLSVGQHELRDGLATLIAIREDFREGMLDDLAEHVEGEIAADYMGQAEALIHDSGKREYDHVPAAVLAGAVLERALRALCSCQTPVVSVTASGGKPLTLNPLIDALKLAGVFNEPIAKQLRAWADIRNKAAHGEFGEFEKGDVARMVEGIGEFLAKYGA